MNVWLKVIVRLRLACAMKSNCIVLCQSKEGGGTWVESREEGGTWRE